MTRTTAVAAALMLGAACITTPAAAEIRTPDCTAIADWAKTLDRNKQWKPNAIGSGRWIPALLAEPSTAALFGKALPAWTEAEATEVVRHMQGCERQFQQARQLEQRNAVETARGWVRNNGIAMLRSMQAARTAVPAELAALDDAPASPQLLRFYAALARAGNSQQTFSAANQAAGQVQGEQQQRARALMAALRDLPEAEITALVAQPATARAEAMRGAVRDGIIADIGRLPVTAQSLAQLAAAPQALRQQYAGSLTASDFGPIDQAIAARRAAIGVEAEADLVKEIGTQPATIESFAAIERLSGEQVLRILPPENATKVRAAAEAQRKKTADAMFPPFQQRLSRLPQTQEGLDAIDNEVMAELGAWPRSAAAEQARFKAAADERRAAILAAVNRAEGGSMRGRTYEGSGFALEFVDRTRVFLKTGGQTAAGTYTEERDGRVVVTVNNQSMVLTREGRKLVGGPTDFRRTK